MQYTGKLLDESYGVAKEILPPLSFDCVVNGKSLKAKVVAALNHPIDYIYRIEFSDGYKSDFYCPGKYCVDVANETEEGETKRYAPYARAIDLDFRSFVGFHFNKEYYCFQLPVKGVQNNVFVIYSETEDKGNLYNVYSNGEYQFSLAPTDKGWHVGSNRFRPGPIDQELARNLTLLVESRH
jgi:hypothetical protein